MKRTLSSPWIRGLFVLAALLILVGNHAYAIPTITVALTASSSSVSAGTAVTLTGTVTSGAGNTPFTQGYVSFCDASATYCEGSALLGKTVVGSGGTAALKLKLGVGTHSIKAAFGVGAGQPSVMSAPVTITVTGQVPTSTQLSASGSSLSATVGYMGAAPVTAGENVSFVDSSNSNYQIGTAVLGAASAPVYSFTIGTGSPFNSGALPFAMATGDFNNDGTPDLAVANLQANTVRIYAGSSTGFTAVGAPIAVGNSPTALCVADVNRDGFADLVVANANDSTVSVLLGDGTGAFSLASTVAVDSGPSSLVVFDTNLDGNPDIVVTSLLASSVSVLIGDGAGHFTVSSVTAYTSSNPSAIVAADFDGDGIEDIAITNTTDGTVAVLLGQGDGTFQQMTGSPFTVPPPASPTATSSPSTLAVGDFDGDGRPDLAIVDSASNRVSILLNPASGMTFTSASITTGSSPSSIVVGDFNGDGKADLAVANANDSTVSLLQGDGTGNFTASAQSPLGNFNSPQAMVSLDLNGDGLQDLAVANGGAGSISLRQQTVAQQATATFTATTIYGAGTHQIQASYSGDGNYAASSSTTVPLTGTQITTTGALSASPGNSIAAGATVQLTDIITPGSEANYSASGTVTFKDGATTVGTASVSNGQAVISVNSLAVGSHTITAAYSGDTNFIANTSSAVSLTIAKSSSATTLISTANTVLVAAPVTFTATVSGSAVTPTGVVNFYDGTTFLSSVPLLAGQASFTTIALAAGTHSITASYPGDSDNSASTSAALSEVIQDFTFTSGGSVPTQTVSPGGTATYQLDFGTSLNTAFPDPITFTVSGLPANATATLSPQSLPAGSTPGNVTLTVQVPTQSAALTHDQLLGRTLAPIALGILLLPFSRRARRSARKLGSMTTLLVVLLGGLAGLIGIAGCGGSSHPATQPENYVITVTATSGTLVHSTTVNLTVD